MADKYYYNGVLLPEITVNLLDGHSYCWIRENKSSGYYDLALSDYPFKFVKGTDGRTSMNEQTDYATKKAWYRVAMSDADSATEWEDNTEAYTFSAWTLDSDRTCIWSNHDIPNGATPSTTVYFPAMKAYRAVDVFTPDAVAISKERLKGFAEQARRLGKISGELTPGQIEEVLRGVTGGASLSLFDTTVTDKPINHIVAPVVCTWDAEVEEYPAKKYSYNGVVLPEILPLMKEGYPYAFIRKHNGSGYYQLILSPNPFYFNGDNAIKEGTLKKGMPRWITPISDPTGWENDTANNNYSGWTLSEENTLLWANHDIPNGSADATEIYFEGSEPVLAE